MANDENKKFQRWLKKLMQEQERERKKFAFEQQRNTRVNTHNYSNYSKPNSSFSRSSSYGGYSENYGFSNHSSRPQRGAIAKSVVVKTNYTFSGRSKSKKGKRLSGKEVIAKAQANLNYITRDGANQDLEKENFSTLYNNTGQLLDKEEYAAFKSDLNEMDISGFRRVIISPKEELTRDEMKDLVTTSLRDFARETGKKANTAFSIHTNTEHIHAHVLIVSENFNDLKWSQNDLQHFKEIVAENTRELINDRELIVDKTILQEFEKARISEQEITKEKEQKNEFNRSL
jgi:hypothetical protein